MPLLWLIGLPAAATWSPPAQAAVEKAEHSPGGRAFTDEWRGGVAEAGILRMDRRSRRHRHLRNQCGCKIAGSDICRFFDTS